ncbi:MAG: hypothetical protein HY832_03500 [Candidatus Aenigmarchaeota archaeon]|nr:hypothetical protein [Candidatus Aenigmarchaeota archaeon]
MVHNYRKGYTAEREMVHTLAKRGYMTIRAPRSGRIMLASPDVIAVKAGKIIVIECKSRKNAFTIPLDQLSQLREWEEKGGARAYVAWKIAHKGWTLLDIATVEKNKGNIGKKFAEVNGFGLDDLEKRTFG